MYGIMVAFGSTRATPVARGCNEGLNLGNLSTNSEYPRTGDTGGGGGGGGAGIKL